MRRHSRLRRGCIAAALAAAGALAAGGVPIFDAVVLAAPLLLPPFVAAAAPPQRRRLQQQFASLLALCPLAALLLLLQQARQLGAGLPPGRAAIAGGYLFALVVALRLAAAAATALLRRCLPRRLAAAVVTTVAVAGFLPLLFVALQTHRIGLATPLHSDLPSRELSFVTADGVTLRATLLLQPRPSPGLVVCHGVGANRADVLAHAELAARLGCQVLLFDFRAHGQSDGFRTSFGARERLDVQAAVTTLLQQPNTEGPGVAVLAISMGGAAALLAAADDPRIAGAMIESAFADLPAMLAERLAVLPSPLRRLGVAATSLAARLVAGVDPADVSPRQALAARCRPLPLVLAHAGDDRVVPLQQGELLAAAAGMPLEHFAGADHGGCLAADPGRYEALLAGLLARTFGHGR